MGTIKHVEAALPIPCRANISKEALQSFVELIVKKSCQASRLVKRGKLLSLPRAEDPTLVLPRLEDRWRAMPREMALEMVWVAWCVELKRPQHAACRYRDSEDNSLVW